MITIKMLSSMEKVFTEREPGFAQSSGSAMKNEVYHFGFDVVNCTGSMGVSSRNTILLEGDLAPFAKCYRVEPVPVQRAAYDLSKDNYYLSHKSGLYPDLCVPVGDRPEYFLPNRHYGYMVEIDGGEKGLPVGRHELRVVIKSFTGETLASESYILEVIDAELPESDLILTHWMHYDCMSHAHKVPVFSDEFYAVCEKYFRAAVKYGQTMAIIPLFTFPLDTVVGGVRDTFQLVKVKVKGGKYEFDLGEVEKFIGFALGCGFKFLEMSHLYSQWGAAATPKVMAEVDGEEKQIFGWDTDSLGEEYCAFMDAFLTKLVALLKKHGWDKIAYFHISDEPGLKHIERYGKIAEFVKARIGDIPIMDALSSYEFYKHGYIDLPAVATDHAPGYFENDARNILVYYCCCQVYDFLSNRMIAMPGQRTRVLGMQLYETGVKGFLQWAFNFYNAGGSIFEIDPYRTTDGTCWVSGDPFIVYPADGDILYSHRLFNFGDGIQDYRALKLLEQKKGRDFVLDLLHKDEVSGFTHYPLSAEWHSRFREKINSLIKESL